jgi:hypothetical protein
MPNSKVTTYYDYTDKDGKLLYQVVRSVPKDFRIRRIADNGKWVWNLGPVARTLYHLRDILNEGRREEPIFVVEGEKDADRLGELGVIATTSPMGASNWCPTFAENFKGRQLIILPDADEPGARYAETVARSAWGLAREIRIVKLPGLPEGGDISDWLDQGHTLDDLRKLIYRSDLYQPNPEAAAASGKMQFPPDKRPSDLRAGGRAIHWIWQGIIAKGAVSLLSAHPKAGKSTLLSLFLRALQHRQPFLGLPTTPCVVYYVTEEQEETWDERCERLGIEDGLCMFKVQPFLLKPQPGEWLDFLDHVSERVIAAGADLLVFDTISALWPVVNENDAAQVQATLMALRGITRTTGAGLLITHHLKKADGLEGTGFRGSSALGGFVDALVELRRLCPHLPNDRRRRLTVVGRWPETPPELTMQLSDDGLNYEVLSGIAGDVSSHLAEQIRQFIPKAGSGVTFEEIAAAWSKNGPVPRRPDLLRVLRLGTELGTWFRSGRGVRGEPFRYTLSAAVPTAPASVINPGADMADADYDRLLSSMLTGEARASE